MWYSGLSFLSGTSRNCSQGLRRLTRRLVTALMTTRHCSCTMSSSRLTCGAFISSVAVFVMASFRFTASLYVSVLGWKNLMALLHMSRKSCTHSSND